MMTLQEAIKLFPGKIPQPSTSTPLRGYHTRKQLMPTFPPPPPPVSSKTTDNSCHVPAEQRCIQAPPPPRSHGGLWVQQTTIRAGLSEAPTEVVSSLQQTLTSWFLSPFTDSLGSLLRKINQRIQSITPLSKDVRDDISHIKKDVGHEEDNFHSFFSKLISSFSLVHETI